MPLRDYQQQAYDDIRKAYREGARSICIVSPTGSGKTALGSEFVKNATARGKKTIWIAHRDELIGQAVERLRGEGIDRIGIVSAKREDQRDPDAPVQVASMQTLVARDMAPPADLLIADECFPAGTLVDGKPIETIRLGDRVNSYNEATDTIESRFVTKIFQKCRKHLCRVETVCGISVTCTWNHPFYVSYGRYVAARDLRIAQKVFLYSENGLVKTWINSIENVTGEPVDVYNLEVDGNHNYFANGILVHNCHHLPSKTYAAVAAKYAKATTLGLTATPVRADGKALGDVFQKMVVVASVGDLVKRGYLVPCSVFSPEKPLGSDFAQDPVDEWQKHGRGKQTILFARSVAEGETLTARLKEQGARAMFIEGNTGTFLRSQAINGFKKGHIDTLVNVYVLTEGFDCPNAEVCILARTCGNVGLWLQIIGRVMRPSPGKAGAKVIDLTGAIWKHHHPEADREFSLEGKPIKLCEDRIQLRQCLSCGFTGLWSGICPNCGVEVVSAVGKPPEVLGEALQEIAISRVAMAESVKKSTLEALVKIAVERGYKPGWISHIYKDKFGEWPPGEWYRRTG